MKSLRTGAHQDLWYPFKPMRVASDAEYTLYALAPLGQAEEGQGYLPFVSSSVLDKLVRRDHAGSTIQALAGNRRA
ncbi:uncharacterized protein PHALS_09543 [Plasmopara halstedii]|uniref:Uncharacterized protein n=1 Tax=Plasmopara halstedii TaxID=4781 RepID=A0A0P1A4G8_PLAHL|nr:uncharacterized protein PHALS_09543 [Plasmopara halstedii]CEG35421.1 hypothetical protein PHALS_09543 [Plasmopara halstedii]|eukprot:XP_024571790.1 hypothetical protein PHALS_09543 [Plasmopara halstedii]